MAYTDFTCTEEGNFAWANSRNNFHWDIAISCYEPLEMVTGGIGTYTRLLADILADAPTLKDKKIALFCRSATASLKAKASRNLQIFEIAEDESIYRKRCERLGNEHDFYSWNLAHYLVELTVQGHSFGLFEFPDYAIESYFSLKMRRAGLLKIDTVAIRLHSPEIMLYRDNLLPGRSYDDNRLTRMSRELFCYRNCDKVLYGAPAMLERVSLECQRFGVEIKSKATHVEHPYPTHDATAEQDAFPKRTSVHLGYIGRMEVRKGILRFLRAIADSEVLCRLVSDLDVVFELFGADCTDQHNRSIRTQIISLQQLPEFRNRIVVHGYMPQGELHEKTQNLDGFVFPSLFENYPNALLEVLHGTAPILISQSGGMPYISRGLPGIHQFNYNSNFVKNVEEYLCSIRPIPTRKNIYFDLAATVNKSIAVAYDHLAITPPPFVGEPAEERVVGVDFVIPFYNDSQHVEECLASIKSVMTGHDNLVVIDDASKSEDFIALEKSIARVFADDQRVQIQRMPVNSGPSAVRNVGAKLGRNAFIQFLDADDILNSTGYRVTKRYIQNNVDVDFVYGIQDNFGARSHVWIPRDASAMTCLDENYTHSAILIRRSIFEESGGFDDEMRLHFEDWQFNCKLALSGYRGEVIPFVTQHYRVREGSRTYLNLDREQFSREMVTDRTCMNRGAQGSLLQGELMELIGKYSSVMNRRWREDPHSEPADEPLITTMSLDHLLNLQGEEFVNAAYAVILGRRADATGLDFYVHKLKSGVSKRSIIADFLMSAEMRLKQRELPREYYSALRFERMVRHPIWKRYLLRKFFNKRR